jgi:hypothetical protein
MTERVPVNREAADREARAAADREARAAANRDARAVAEADRPISLFHDEETRGFRTRWDGIQTGFVDQPRAAVEQANALVGEMQKKLTDTFGAERAQLESQWSRGQEVSTEDLRIALKRYRSFFERLLSI